MMGPQKRREPKLFYVGVNLDERVPGDHPLRRIAEAIDFTWVRPAVRGRYGRRGNPSVDPVVLLKLMVLLFYEKVPSERALMAQLPLRLDWLWFCGYDLDEKVPDHSVISKARRRWGPAVFEAFFGRVLAACVEAGLVNGTQVHVDSSLVEADADRRALVPAGIEASRQMYRQLEAAASAEPGAGGSAPEPVESPTRPVSPTDPDARLTRKGDRTVLGYKDHRAVDDHCGVVTATVTTHGAVADEARLEEVLRRHEQGVGTEVQTVVADARYGTGETYERLRRRGTRACIPTPRRARRGRFFGPERFQYDAERDEYICPAGQRLHRSDRRPQKGAVRYYATRGTCEACPLRPHCTKGRRRQIARHACQEAIDWAAGCVSQAERRRLMRRRKVRAEGSFADATARHGFKRARWRRLWRVRIQNLLIAAVQDIRKLLRYARWPRVAGAQALRPRPRAAFLSGIRRWTRGSRAAIRRLGRAARAWPAPKPSLRPASPPPMPAPF